MRWYRGNDGAEPQPQAQLAVSRADCAATVLVKQITKYFFQSIFANLGRRFVGKKTTMFSNILINSLHVVFYNQSSKH